MIIEEGVEYLTQGRIVDLSKKVIPGKAEGPVDTGKQKYEIKPFPYPPGELMDNIDRSSSEMGGLEAFPIRALAIEGTK